MRTKNIFLALALMVAAMLLSAPVASAQNLTPKVNPKSGLYGYWGTKKNGDKAFIIKPKFDKAERFVNGHAFVSVNGAWYIIGNDGKALLSTTYSEAFALGYDHYRVCQDGKYGVVDLRSLTEILPIKYDAIDAFDDKYKLKIEGRYGLVDKACKEILPIKYDKIDVFDDKYKLTIDGKLGLADKLGTEILPIKYDKIDTYDGKYKLTIDGKLGLADKVGKEILPIKYDAIDTFDGKYKLTIDGKHGLADKVGKEILPIKYDKIDIYDHKYKLTIDGKQGLADKSGSEILPIKYDAISALGNAYKVAIGNKYGVVDGENKEIIPIKYDAISVLDINAYVVAIGDKWGIVDKTNKVIVEPQYKAIECIDGGLYALLSDKWIFVDSSGKVVDISDRVMHYTTNDGQKIAENPADQNLFCDGVGVLVFTNAPTSIGKYAFRDCSSLTSITIPDGVTSIEWGAFKGCSSLTSITIPDSVTSIGSDAFDGCSNIEEITAERWIGYAFDKFAGLKTINDKEIITDGVFKFLGDKLVWVDRGLSSVSIPATVKSIHPKAFAGCEYIKNVNVADLNLWLRSGVDMSYCSSWQLYHNGKLVTNVTIPNGVTEIADGQFCDNKSLTSITIPNSVTKIGESAFYGCSSLGSITIPASVKEIGESAFEDYRRLTSITILENVIDIGKDAFKRDQDWGTFYIYMKSITPPALGGRFENWYRNTWGEWRTTDDVDVIIYVPENALFNYRSADVWKEMADIIYPMN